MIPIDAELTEARATIKRIIDGNIMLRSAAIALGIYDKAILYLPELLIIIAENQRGRQIMNELGLDDIESLTQNGKRKHKNSD